MSARSAASRPPVERMAMSPSSLASDSTDTTVSRALTQAGGKRGNNTLVRRLVHYYIIVLLGMVGVHVHDGASSARCHCTQHPSLNGLGKGAMRGHSCQQACRSLTAS